LLRRFLQFIARGEDLSGKFYLTNFIVTNCFVLPAERVSVVLILKNGNGLKNRAVIL